MSCSEPLDWRCNTATAEEIARHLAICDSTFRPALSQRVDLADYARRLAGQAERLEAWQAGRLVGLVAAYCNDRVGATAFVSNVSVVPEWQRRGVAAQLLAACLARAASLGMRRVRLEVSRAQSAAHRLYQGAGFREAGGTADTLLLECALDAPGSAARCAAATGLIPG